MRRYTEQAVEAIDPNRFVQEDDYTAALAGRLVGTAYEGAQGRVTFQSTVATSAGRNSAERRTGTDVAFVVTLTQGPHTVRKAILAQAKKGSVGSLSPHELGKLKEQLTRIMSVVSAPKVLEIPGESGVGVNVKSGRKVLVDETASSIPLGSYFTRFVLTCIEGDTSLRTLGLVQDSRMTSVRISAERKQ